MWWLAWGACELAVDFDPETTSTPSGSTAETGDPVGPPDELPAIVQGTECGGFVPEPIGTTQPIDVEFEPLTGPLTLTDVEIEELAFAVDTNVAITIGEVPGPRIEPPNEEGAIVFAHSEAEQLLVLSFCGLSSCQAQTLRITLPEAVDRILGQAERGHITVTDAAVTDVYVGTNLGDVQVTGNALGIRAEALDGSVSVDAPVAQIVDLHASTGLITMRGTATTEFCAISDLGDLDVILEASERASMRATNGNIVADLASRAAYLELSVVAGGADVRLPGGAYNISLVSIPENGLTLQGIVNDATATDQIVGSSLGTGILLRAR